MHDRNEHANSYRGHISEGKCEKAQETIPLEKSNNKFMRYYKGAMGYLTTIPLIAVTVPVDLILMLRCRYGCPKAEKRKKILEFMFPTTSWTYETSKPQRCPDNSYYINKFLEIASCYENRGDKNSLAIAYDQLDNLSQSYDSTFTCIQIRDGQVIKEQRFRVLLKLSELNKKKQR